MDFLNFCSEAACALIAAWDIGDNSAWWVVIAAVAFSDLELTEESFFTFEFSGKVYKVTWVLKVNWGCSCPSCFFRILGPSGSAAGSRVTVLSRVGKKVT